MNRQINYKTMRIIVGCIALFLAPVVCFLAGAEARLDSISISYWTDSRDIFVGSLIAVGFFLSAYNGSGGGGDLEFYLSKISCVFAISVALFPTTGFYPDQSAPEWGIIFAKTLGLMPQHVHYMAAVLLFFSLTAIMWCFSVRAMRKAKIARAYTYRIISGLMLVGMVAIFYIGKYLEWEKTIFYVEVWGLTLFGLGWLIAGLYKKEENLCKQKTGNITTVGKTAGHP
jgi:hypothetical protein